MAHDAVDILHQVFPGLDEIDVAELANVAELRTYPADTVLCHEGHAEEIFYIIISGRAEVSKHLQEGAQRVLYTIAQLA